ncbi:MAG TPA: cation-translocating P-type ATPase, partial [Phycisphaerae bacterium]|nr:cation-translocating P-type ATPase [Phycisphaerae bacterium]
ERNQRAWKKIVVRIAQGERCRSTCIFWGGIAVNNDSAVALESKVHDHQNDGFACACGHEHDNNGQHNHAGVGLNFQLTVLVPITVALLILACIFYQFPTLQQVASALGLLAAIVSGGPIIWQAIKGLAHGQTNVNELVAMSVIGAIALGWLVEAGLVALILQIGSLIEQVAAESARNAVLALQNLAPVHARVRRNNKDIVIQADELREGDTLVIQPGERIAGDGVVLSGSTSVDESMVTGESIPVDKTPGGTVLAGTINLTGSAEVQVTRVGEHSALGQTIALVRRAQQYQPNIVRAADRFFAFYTPIILVLSVIAWWVTGAPGRMITMWVVGCPCAMLLASPLAIVVALARASRSGIQIKAGPFVEASVHLDTVVFDKTGTLTTGKFVVQSVRPVEGVSEEELLRLAATVENRSTHPLARAIIGYVKDCGINYHEAADIQILEGLGVEAAVDGKLTRVGSAKILSPQLVSLAASLEDSNAELPLVPVYVTYEGRLLGAICLTDEIRPEARRAIKRLRNLGIKRIVMMTGDRRKAAQMVGRAVGCDDIYAELLPGQKEELVRQLQRGDHGVAMVGEGINDAPSLAAATVGIALGLRGTDAAIEAADAILLKDDLTRIPLLIYLARQTRVAIFQNLGLALLFAGFAELAAAFGLFGPVWAALLHMMAVVVIAANSVRLAGGIGVNRKPLPAPAKEPVQDIRPALQPV